MASGRPPFRAATTYAVLKRLVEDDSRSIRELIPEMPQWPCAIISKLQTKKPEDRYQSATGGGHREVHIQLNSNVDNLFSRRPAR